MAAIHAVTDAPESEASDAYFRSVHQHAGGTVVVSAPSSGALVHLATSLLEALGKQIGLAGEPLRTKHDWDWALCWLAGLRVKRLVAYRAHLLTHYSLECLMRAAAEFGIDLFVVADLDLCAHHDVVTLTRFGGRVRTSKS